MDILCVVCGEPWDAYGLQHGDVEPWEYELFNKGAGCPSCEGVAPKDGQWQPETIFDIDNGDLDPALRLAAHEDYKNGKAPKWEEPPPPPPPIPIRGCVYEAAMPDEIMYADIDEEHIDRYDSFTYGKLSQEESYYSENVEVIVPQYCSGGDYAGSTVERANYLAFMEKFGELPEVFEVYGGYGSFAVVILASSNNKEIAECLCALRDYPVIDDEKLSEYEMELSDEAYENWGRVEFRQEIEKKFGITLDDLENNKLDELFHIASEASNTYWECDGTDMYIRMEHVVESIDVQVTETPSVLIDPWEDDKTFAMELFVDSKWCECTVVCNAEPNEDMCVMHETIVLLDHVYRL